MPRRNNLVARYLNVDNRKGFIRSADVLLRKVHSRHYRLQTEAVVDDDQTSNHSGNSSQPSSKGRSVDDGENIITAPRPFTKMNKQISSDDPVDEIERLRLKVEMLEKLVADKHTGQPKPAQNDGNSPDGERKPQTRRYGNNQRGRNYNKASRNPQYNREFHQSHVQPNNPISPLKPQQHDHEQPWRKQQTFSVISPVRAGPQSNMQPPQGLTTYDLLSFAGIKLCDENEKISQLKFKEYENKPPLIPVRTQVHQPTASVASSIRAQTPSPKPSSSSSYSMVPPQQTAVLNLYETQQQQFHDMIKQQANAKIQQFPDVGKAEKPQQKSGFFKNLFNLK